MSADALGCELVKKGVEVIESVKMDLDPSFPLAVLQVDLGAESAPEPLLYVVLCGRLTNPSFWLSSLKASRAFSVAH